jgi:hypothetical protein
MKWQPIETAPRGLVLLYWPASKPARGGHASNSLPPMIRVDYSGSTPNRPPTHWMPLPEPPDEPRYYVTDAGRKALLPDDGC